MPDRKQYPQVKLRAKVLRKTLTCAEQTLWSQLRNRRLCGLKFRRQHPFGPYIADFYCAQYRLVVELDGGVHRSQAAYDKERTQYLATLGYQVLRMNNEQVENELERVLSELAAACGAQRPSPKPALSADEGLGEGQADVRQRSGEP